MSLTHYTTWLRWPETGGNWRQMGFFGFEVNWAWADDVEPAKEAARRQIEVIQEAGGDPLGYDSMLVVPFPTPEFAPVTVAYLFEIRRGENGSVELVKAMVDDPSCCI